MTSYTFETRLGDNHDGNTTPDIVDYFRATLAGLSAPLPAGDSIELDSPVSSPTSWAELISGVSKFHFDDAVFSGQPFTRIFSYMPFGYSATELMAWWFHGGGAALHRSLTDAIGVAGDYVLVPLDLQQGECGGWFREALTLKKLLDGQYSDGTPIKVRLYQESALAMVRAFPNVTTPIATPGFSFLADVFTGVYTGGENSNIRGDASQANGLFPNFPFVAGSCISGGLTHFYMQAPWTPSRIRWCVINKPFWNGAPDGSDILPPDATHLSVQQRMCINAAGEAAALRNLAWSATGQDALVKTMQDLGAVVHEQFPTDVLRALRDAVNQIHDENAAADADYKDVLDSVREFARANQIRWRANGVDKYLRFADRPLYQPELAPNRLR